MSEMNHERFDELKDAFVLGALPEDERREFEEYLAAHPERQAEIDELAAVAGLLALSPQEQEPPPELRRSIMEVVEAESERPSQQSRSGLARLGELLSVRNLALGAAALLVVGLLSWNVLLQSQMQEMQDQARSPQPPQDSRVVELEGSGAARQAKAEVMILGEDRAVLMAEDMPPVPENKTCQIWVIEDAVPKPDSLFKPEEDPVAVVVENPVSGADAIAVSLEPEGGSTEPTTDPMLVAEL
jgi:anti-sigma-K factor RskA